ncbi:glycosyltransferase family 4 protein [Arenibacter latericius]|uniref:glycosyltransferase family 4 protein n=1 Tax=Arenibacter latericius TaxID=86104 RepID=UPI00040B8F8C|nr:glycosyltransferase family 4 protein [Arenibacter latericius]
MKLISLYSKFSNVGGAQKMCLNIHKGLSEQGIFSASFISSLTAYEEISTPYKKLIPKNSYQKFNIISFIKNHKDAIFISHHRQLTTLLVLFSKLLNKELIIFHVAHNEFNNLKYFTLFPKNIIAVSEGVKRNHIDYFNLDKIDVIYNGIKAPSKIVNIEKKSLNPIKILIPGRITKVKQQLEIVKALKNRMPKEIQIIFAGTGDLFGELKECTIGDSHFQVLGQVSNMQELYLSVDYVMLFSLKEGLPLSLIEACSYGLPILCNDVGGNLEILENDYNGFLLKDLNSLPKKIMQIKCITPTQYRNLSINSRRIFENKFNYENMILNYKKYILENV